MATNKSSANKIPEWAGGGNKSSGIKLDPGPFIGIIKNNVDPSRQGRLSVWIPDIGGQEEDATKWYVVRYASPFFGSTLGQPGTSNTDKFGVEQQSYGFWAIPPDIGNLVLISFVMGDPSRGFWFACIPNTQSQHMVPAIARPGTEATPVVPTEFGQGRIKSGDYVPSSELNYETAEKDKTPKFYELPKVIHTYQANVLIEQGLESDPIRGTVTSSSQRETPSYVFGISTPGRTTEDFAENPNIDFLIKAGAIKNETIQKQTARKGGHSFVMDDGTLKGESRLVRLRSAAGHQILMHDTENTLYISNSLGTAWVELNGDGSVNVFSGGSVNIRASQDLNLHADNDVNIHAGNNLRMYAGALIHSQTKTQLTTVDDLYNINSGIIGVRCGGGFDIRTVSLTTEAAAAITLNSATGTWQTSGTIVVKAASGSWSTSGETTVHSSTGGWQTSGELKLVGSQIHLNSPGKAPGAALGPSSPVAPEINPKMEFYNQVNARYDTDLNKWYKVQKDFESIAVFTPTHEPWARATGRLKLVNGEVVPSESQYVKK
jgi:hypothetical protein